MESIKIHVANISNIAEIERIEKELIHRNLSYNSLESDLTNPNRYYIVAVSNNIIVGYAGAELLVDHADITAIAVDNNFKRKGIATLLLTSIFLKCKELKMDKIFLEVRSSNVPAKNLYEKLGFNKISTRKNYYENVEDADIYVKDLV